MTYSAAPATYREREPEPHLNPMMRAGETASRRAHNPQTPGSTPGPATNYQRPRKPPTTALPSSTQTARGRSLLRWDAAWWRVARDLLVHFARFDPATKTAGEVLHEAMHHLGMRDPKIPRAHCVELAERLGLDALHLAALLDDTARVDLSTAAQLARATDVPTSYWLDLRMA